ncbi:16S rRNA (cytosine(967)-C(5))-methyltransferase RsmB [Myxococcota bacterium]|nr:16S rRNA (cytosine(967)-C(5))-methyltransferase RsmB [Myxococcota bacterium]MBU1429019.1 16S rRNA (cytosine(967)-C(5))-methyltransferase RsmB [Myxococcota bacterium]MBU1898425.1 16S rRNA (cytosine(967)-C(5))-methyltransferase RsmB [Myxococcota bacterium]
MSKPILTGREVALIALTRLEDGGAFIQRVIDAETAKAGLDPRERGFVRALVMGVARARTRLEFSLERHLKKGLKSTNPALRRIMLMALYQILFMDKVPDRAAVHSAVQLAKAKAGEGGGRLVNGVLRGFLRQGEALPEGDNDAAWAVRLSQPEWLVTTRRQRLGQAGMVARAEAENQPAPLTLRPDDPGLNREALMGLLRLEGGAAELGRYSPHALHLTEHPGPFTGTSFTAGLWKAQDEAAQLVVRLLDPQPGEDVWDVCAAPGGKTRYISRLMGGRGRLLASDSHAKRVSRMRRALEDLPVESRIYDAKSPLDERFDRVLIDAPCSGLGVIRRHPEIRWRRDPFDLRASAEAQLQILSAASGSVKVDGVLVYSVCTDTEEEGWGVLKRFLAARPEFVLDDLPTIQGIDWAGVCGPDGVMETSPERHGMDGFFAARLRRLA